jgi:hypothetical protein
MSQENVKKTWEFLSKIKFDSFTTLIYEHKIYIDLRFSNGFRVCVNVTSINNFYCYHSHSFIFKTIQNMNTHWEFMLIFLRLSHFCICRRENSGENSKRETFPRRYAALMCKPKFLGFCKFIRKMKRVTYTISGR